MNVQTRGATNTVAFAASLDDRLATLRHGSSAESARFDRCLDRLLGRVPIYNPQPLGLLFPFLQNYEFFSRDHLPWLEELEAATDAIRDELEGVLATDRELLKPYISYQPGWQNSAWAHLPLARRWTAYMLWDLGRRLESHLARCPRTAAALAKVPMIDIPGCGPNAMFSVLDSRTHIPPHCGVTNIRLTVHLPLIVPHDCRLRVGGETRECAYGRGWAFDDTIEHEAWNDSDELRVVLIFHTWNPQLTALERDLVRETIAALIQHSSARANLTHR